MQEHQQQEPRGEAYCGQEHHEQHSRQRLQSHGQHAQQQEGEQEHQLLGVKRRRVCAECDRPCSVCYCDIIKGRELNLSDESVSCVVERVLIFMHPLEKKRKSGSVQVLQKLIKGLEVWPHRKPGCCPFATEQQQRQQHEQHELRQEQTVRHETAAERAVLADAPVEEPKVSAPTNPKDKKEAKLPQQQQHLCTREGTVLCDTSRMVLLFPTESSFPLGEGTLPFRLPLTLLAIDGTWKEAKEMFKATPWLQQLPAVHLPLLKTEGQADHCGGGGVAAAAVADLVAADCGSSNSEDTMEAVRVSGAYGMIRTPPARIAASGGVCTAEAVAEALSIIGRWARSGSSSLLQIGETTRETLQRIVSLQQEMRDRNKSRQSTD